MINSDNEQTNPEADGDREWLDVLESLLVFVVTASDEELAPLLWALLLDPICAARGAGGRR